MPGVSKLPQLLEAPVKPSVSTWKRGLQTQARSPADMGWVLACHLAPWGRSSPSFSIAWKVGPAGVAHLPEGAGPFTLMGRLSHLKPDCASSSLMLLI